ncbi:MAG: hypothetical protein IKJ65_10975 [Clostridia bacterium]|nr:hypothetical protein [Clostridia bacterium]
MAGIVCSICGFTTLYDSEKPVFCAKCANRFRSGEDFRDELSEALKNEDYLRRFEALSSLREKHAGVYEIELEILCLGRLYEKGGKPDFYRIPYWPLAAFDTPRDFSKKDREKMLRTLFESEGVLKVKSLAPSESVFWQDYLFRMSRGYVSLFIKSSNANSTFLGFRRRLGDTLKRCAYQLGDMLSAIDDSAYPEENIRRILIENLKKAFISVFEGSDAENTLKSVLHPEKKRK